MLEIKDLSLQVGPDDQFLLAEIAADFPRRHFTAIIGPSGCGKSTLLKVIAGIREPTIGQVSWDGRDLASERDFDPHEIGYVPQFGIAYEHLTVWESVETALRLRVRRIDGEETRIEQILQDTGIEDLTDRRVSLLSGGQRRRLALALEMVCTPHLLLCDEVTSGLDPQAEDEIVHLLHALSRRENRIILSVTHSLRHLALYDSVLVLYHGHIAYHGAPDTLLHYFGVAHPDELYPQLAVRRPEDWHRSWQKNRAAYYAELASRTAPKPLVELAAASNQWQQQPVLEPGAAEPAPDALRPADAPETKPPSAFAQFAVLLTRRWRLFVRDRGQLFLQLALLVGFPCLVVIFALDGLPQLKMLTGDSGGVLAQIQAELAHRTEFIQAGGLVSGLVMFQVILLALTGSNNAAREIASERLIFEKEKFAGLRPASYIASKAAFLGTLVIAQSVWMAVFVNLIVRLPGNLIIQIALLTLVNGALTSICLGLSSLMKSAEQASLVSVYLVGFQLPLSGAVLALPAALGWITRPFIASFWGWSGFIQTFRDTRYYEAIQLVTKTPLASLELAIWVLTFHVILGLFVAFAGSKSSRWE